MYYNNKLSKGLAGVSPVIATILMVSITVILGAVVWFWVGSMIVTPKAKEIQYAYVQDLDDYGNYVIRLTSATKVVAIRYCKFHLRDTNDQWIKLQQDELKEIYGYKVTEDVPVIYYDHDRDAKLTEGDTFVIKSVANGGYGNTGCQLYIYHIGIGDVILRIEIT